MIEVPVPIELRGSNGFTLSLREFQGLCTPIWLETVIGRPLEDLDIFIEGGSFYLLRDETFDLRLVEPTIHQARSWEKEIKRYGAKPWLRILIDDIHGNPHNVDKITDLVREIVKPRRDDEIVLESQTTENALIILQALQAHGKVKKWPPKYRQKTRRENYIRLPSDERVTLLEKNQLGELVPSCELAEAGYRLLLVEQHLGVGIIFLSSGFENQQKRVAELLEIVQPLGFPKPPFVISVLI